jgi:hypothetical protein
VTEVGWVAQVLVNKTTGHVVDGHLRVELAISRNEQTVPVTYVELSKDEERLVLATLDPLAAMASADTAKLAELLADLTPSDDALPGPGGHRVVWGAVPAAVRAARLVARRDRALPPDANDPLSSRMGRPSRKGPGDGPPATIPASCCYLRPLE